MSEMTDNNAAIPLSRRAVLKAAGATAGIGGFGGVTSAQQGTQGNCGWSIGGIGIGAPDEPTISCPTGCSEFVLSVQEVSPPVRQVTLVATDCAGETVQTTERFDDCQTSFSVTLTDELGEPVCASVSALEKFILFPCGNCRPIIFPQPGQPISEE